MSLNDKFTMVANSIRSGAKITHLLSIDDMVMVLSSRVMQPASGVNLLQGSDPDETAVSDPQINEYKLTIASGGNGVGSLIDLDPKQFKAKHGFRIANNTSGARDFNQRPVFYGGSKYTFSVWARIAPGFALGKGYCYIRSWSAKYSHNLTGDLHLNLAKEWQKLTITFDASSWHQDETASFAFGVNGQMSADFAEPMLEVGDTAHDWQPSPYDKLGG